MYRKEMAHAEKRERNGRDRRNGEREIQACVGASKQGLDCEVCLRAGVCCSRTATNAFSHIFSRMSSLLDRRRRSSRRRNRHPHGRGRLQRIQGHDGRSPEGARQWVDGDSGAGGLGGDGGDQGGASGAGEKQRRWCPFGGRDGCRRDDIDKSRAGL